MEDMLKIKVTDNKVPGYQFVLCKLGLQLFDNSSVRVDY